MRCGVFLTGKVKSALREIKTRQLGSVRKNPIAYEAMTPFPSQRPGKAISWLPACSVTRQEMSLAMRFFDLPFLFLSL